MMFTRPLLPCWNTMQAAPVRSSSITASLTENPQRRGGLGDDHGIVAVDLVFALGRRRLDDVTWRIERRRAHFRDRHRGGVGLTRGPILEAALVAPRPLLDHGEGLVGAGIGIGGVGVGLQRNSGIQMQRAVGAETETILAQRDVAGIIAVEIFTQHLIGALADTPAQRVADADAFSRDPESHLMPRLVC